MNWPGVLSWGWIGCLLPLLSGCGGSGEGASGEAVMEEKSGLPNPSGPEVALPEGMVRIPGGSFLMGSYSGMPNEQPVHRVKVDAFWLDETEVTNAEFRQFVEETGYVSVAERPLSEAQLAAIPPDYRPEGEVTFGAVLFTKTDGPVPLNQMNAWWRMEFDASWRKPNGPESSIEGKDDHPVVCVTFEDAMAYAEWAGKRLPTEAEWEFAARGGLEGKKYPWGNGALPNEKESQPEDWPANLWQGKFPYDDWATDGYSGTSPVKSYAPNDYGLYDMTGNVWEFCSDWYDPQYYQRSPEENPLGPERSRGSQSGAPAKAMRGASWRIHRSYGPSPRQGMPPVLEYRLATRNEADVDTATNDAGFRCAMDG